MSRTERRPRSRSTDGRSALSERAWVRESEAEVAGCPCGEGGGEHGDFDVVVVVDLGGLLGGMGAEDVLDEASLERGSR